MEITVQAQKQRQRAPSKRSLATREKILNAAEMLFAQTGYEGTSIREIAERAGVQKALVNFHGGPKEDLFFKVVERRAKELSDCRMQALTAMLAGQEKVTVGDIISCFIAPYMEKATNGGIHWRAYARLVAQVSADERWAGISQACFDPTAQVFIEEICKRHPMANRLSVSSGFVFCVASMLAMVTSMWRMDALSATKGLTGSEDTFARLPLLVKFCNGGMEDILQLDGNSLENETV